MSLPDESHQGSFFDACVLFEDLFSSPGNRYRLFREKIWPCLWARRQGLAGLYCADNGRPAIEPVVLLGATLLQFMEKVPDRVAAEHVAVHLGWKYALNLESRYGGFHATSLKTFRDRLLEGGAERIGFDAILEGLKASGLVRRNRKERLDSTHIVGAVSRMGRLEVVRETIRLFVERIHGLPEVARPESWAIWVERYVESDFPWHRASLQTLTEKFTQAGQDALEMIRWARGQGEPVRDDDQTVLLERVFLEQYEWAQETEPQRRKHEAGGVVKNPHDPDVQWSTKDPAKDKQWEGYKGQLAETVAEDARAQAVGEPTEQFLTEVTTTRAITSDLEGRAQVEQHQQASGVGVAREVHVDGAYVTGQTLAQARDQGRELVGPARESPQHMGGFPSDRFDVDIAHRRAVCPAGHASTQCSRLENQQTGQGTYRFEWASQCDACPLQKECTRSRSGRRTLVVGEHHDLVQARRREMDTEGYRQRMRQRNGIEGTISEFVRAGGRRTRYRGLRKVTLGNYLIGAVVNIKRWIRLMQWRMNLAAAVN